MFIILVSFNVLLAPQGLGGRRRRAPGGDRSIGIISISIISIISMISCIAIIIITIIIIISSSSSSSSSTSEGGHTGRPHPQKSDLMKLNRLRLQWISSVVWVFSGCLHLIHPI